MPFLPRDKFGLLSTRGGRGRPTHPIVRSQLNENTYTRIVSHHQLLRRFVA
jgi:hypothetical protein